MIIIQTDILKTLSYFDIFRYPLTAEEIFLHRRIDYTENELKHQLESLIIDGQIYQNENFYSLINDPDLALNRVNGNKRAVQQLKIAARSARILSYFPFVTGIAISGSLSKNFSGENDDIDFFIITAADRLWIARSFLHVFLKFAFLFKKQKWFCLNYYIDETALLIPEQNTFTAIEIITLKPFYGNGIFDKFAAANEWTKQYFPYYFSNNQASPRINSNFFKKALEKIFSGRIGDRLDNWLMKITDARWQKKVRRMQLNERGIRLSMLVSKHFAKPDPQFFQPKILDTYASNIKKIRHYDREKPDPLSVLLSE